MSEPAVVEDAPAPRELADWLLARGRHWVTTGEAAVLLGIPEGHVAPSLARWRQRGHWFSPTKGLYVAIPPEFRSWGAVPAAHFIDPLMGHLGHDYYVGLLSAAEVHGFAHQRPQVFQVMTPARLRDRAFGRVRLEFVASRHTAERTTDVVNTPTGTMRVSTVETTVLDLVSFPNLSGALFNVATIIGDMLTDEAIDVARLADAASGYPASIAQRAGWLLDYMAEQVDVDIDTDPLLPAAATRTTPALLVSDGGRHGEHDLRWNVIVNEYPDDESLIPRAAITEWGRTVAWPTVEQVEQDLLLSRLIVEIANDDYLGEELVFRGGTCLHKLHAPRPLRYSEDLDYVRTTGGGIADLTRAVSSIGERLGMEVRTRLTEHPKIFLRSAFESGTGRMRIKIEVNTFERSPARPVVRLPYRVESSWFAGDAEVRTFRLDELVATKLRALFQRSKGRDLFDLWLVLTQMGVAPTDLVESFAPYRPEGYTRARAATNLLEKAARSSFRDDLRPLVTAWPASYDIEAAAELVIRDVLALVE